MVNLADAQKVFTLVMSLSKQKQFVEFFQKAGLLATLLEATVKAGTSGATFLVPSPDALQSLPPASPYINNPLLARATLRYHMILGNKFDYTKLVEFAANRKLHRRLPPLLPRRLPRYYRFSPAPHGRDGVPAAPPSNRARAYSNNQGVLHLYGPRLSVCVVDNTVADQMGIEWVAAVFSSSPPGASPDPPPALPPPPGASPDAPAAPPAAAARPRYRNYTCEVL
ncbi:unnamed protein product [Closterium sp. NIES-64]|nr:unnamed protein product [Closterium sp. NIES-64]